MRLLPLQIDMLLLAGEWLPHCEPEPLSLVDRLQSARQSLIERTGQDFGYNLRAWHVYLVSHHKRGYCWSNEHLSIAVRIREAEADPQWRDAAAALQADA